METTTRIGFIGGSDAPVIAGLSKWKTPLELYLEKRGELSPEDISDHEAVHFGTVLEDTVADEFARRTGKTVHRVNTPARHEEYDWMRAQLDRRVVGESACLECKTTNPFSFQSAEWGEPGTDLVPEYYLVQCQHQLMVTGYDMAYLAVLVGGQRFAHYEIPRDESLISVLMDLEIDFWSAIESGTPPDPDYSHPTALELMKRRYPGTNGRVVMLPDRAQELADRYAELGTIEREARKERDVVKAELLSMCGDAAVGLLPDGTGFTRKVIAEKAISYTRKAYVDFRFAKNPKTED